jgi:hypothetical protein
MGLLIGRHGHIFVALKGKPMSDAGTPKTQYSKFETGPVRPASKVRAELVEYLQNDPSLSMAI